MESLYTGSIKSWERNQFNVNLNTLLTILIAYTRITTYLQADIHNTHPSVHETSNWYPNMLGGGGSS